MRSGHERAFQAEEVALQTWVKFWEGGKDGGWWMEGACGCLGGCG